MEPVRLVHWNRTEAARKSVRVESWGYRVDDRRPGPGFVREVQRARPAAVVVDLERLPGTGRDLALGLRDRKGTRTVPIVFVGGAPEKVARFKAQLPDAVFTTWRGLRRALASAIANPPANPVVPSSALAGYSGTPLPKKLGIKENSVVMLLRAPEDFEATLGELPGGVKLRYSARGKCDLAIWFVMSARELRQDISRMGNLGPALWIAWPKRASGVETDVTQTTVRATGLDSGLVDYKICAIDSTWSALKFARRK